MSILKFLGNQAVEDFMKNDWHVRPKVFRKVFPDFEPICDIDTIFDLAADEDIESRLITRDEDEWSLEHGPFEDLPDLNQRNWTVLVQGLDLHLPEAHDFLRQFRFIPDARLDDLMLSLASDGGGVGPHYDSYDVFLVQMHGKRRWKIGPLKNKNLIEDAPLKLLAEFEPDEELILEPGDVLYLPPNYGHDGTAVGVCSTLSVGFRAMTKAEVIAAVFRDLADQAENDENLKSQLFSDPGRGQCDQPAEIPDDLLTFMLNTIQENQPGQSALIQSAGLMLSEPKPLVYFDQSAAEDMEASEIVEVFGKRGLALGMGTRILYKNNHFFVNGEALKVEDSEASKLLKFLANEGEMSAKKAKQALENETFSFYAVGFAKAGWLNTLE